MRDNYGVSTRRILTFPAVYPCEDTSPATLLGSLIDLATDICGCKPESLPANKRNARETIRLVGLILVFLEEAHETRPDLPIGSAMLSLSELHLAFQKIRYLTEDCAREGARSWMVMESERVADQFHQLIRAMSTALEVLRLDRVDVPAEVKEIAELVRMQSRKARLGMEGSDERLRSEVCRCLNNFSNGVAPESLDLRNILLDFGIRCWDDCDREIKFLEEEIRLETTMSSPDAGERHDLSLLSGLLGFMSYCRCVLFDLVDNKAAAAAASPAAVRETATLNCLDPDLFLCPISLEIMSDPVTVTATGQTYDRSSILKWIKAGNSTCPRTGEKLAHVNLVPNLVVRQLLRQFCASRGIPIEELSSTAAAKKAVSSVESPAAEGAAKMAARFLASRFVVGTVEERRKAAFEIRLLTKRSVVSRSCLVESGTIPHLLGLLSSAESQVREDSMAALLNLSKHPLGRAQIVENGGLILILHALKTKGSKLEVQQLAAAALYYLASVEEYRKLIGEIPEAIPALVELIRNGTQHGKKNAIVTILNLLMHRGNHGRVLAAGAVPELVRVSTSSQREDLITDSLAALSCLAQTTDDGTAAILSERETLQAIVVTLGSTASRLGKEHCVSLLLALSINGGRDVVSVLVKNHHLMELLYSQLAEGTSRASKKASALIRLLHAFSERDSNSLVTPAAAIQHDRFVHVW